MRRAFLLALLISAGCATAPAGAGETPNIVYLLADDLGYGDLSCLNKDSKIGTPNMDRLASQGMIFTDAHSGSAVCTPTAWKRSATPCSRPASSTTQRPSSSG